MISHFRRVFPILILWACWFLAWPQPATAVPVLKSLGPPGAQRGTTFTLTLTGQELSPGSELITTLPATISRLAPPKDLKKPETELPFLIELRPDAPVALYPIRLKGPDGISNLLLFSVGDFAELAIKKELEVEVKEKKPNLKVTPPVVINSSLRQADQDVFSFSARTGEVLVFEVEARRLGSAIDPVLRILNGAGREIAANDDAPGLGVDSRVQVRFPRDDQYSVVVHDSRFSDQEQNFYRLKIGNFLYAEGLFPLGWQRDKTIEVTLFGGNLPKPITVRPNLELPRSQKVALISLPATKGQAGSLSLPFVVDDLPEILEPGSKEPVQLTSDTVVNGRISKPGERDLYRLAVKPGEKWLFEVQAGGLGTTRMGAYLAVLADNGKLLASAVDAAGLIKQTDFSFVPREKGVDPKMVFEVPERVENLTLVIEDINHGGGPDFGYRLRATRRYEDFSLEFVSPFVNIPTGGAAAIQVRVARDSYDGPIKLSVANTRDEILVEGGHIPSRVREGLIVVTSRSGVRLSTVDLEVWGEGVSSTGEPIRRRAAGPGLVTPVKGARREVGGGSIETQRPYQAKWLGMELPVGISRPVPLNFELSERTIKLVQGLSHDLRLKLNRDVPITTPIRIDGLKPGGGDVTIKGGVLEPKYDSIPVQVSANFNAQIGRFDMVLLARADIGGRQVQAVSPAITVDLVRAFALVISSDVIPIESGAKFTFEGKVHRQYPFTEAVSLKVEDLPLHVTCAATEVSEIDSTFKLQFQADPAAEPGEYVIRLVSSARMEGRKDNKDYTIPDVKLRLKIIPASTGANLGDRSRN